MEIRTKATFFDEKDNKEIEAHISFNIYSIEFANETPEGYTSIMFSSTGTQITVKIKYKTWWNLIEKYNLQSKTIIE